MDFDKIFIVLMLFYGLKTIFSFGVKNPRASKGLADFLFKILR